MSIGTEADVRRSYHNREAARAARDRRWISRTLTVTHGGRYLRALVAARGDSFELVVESPPQVARHQGYETAFIEMPSMSVEVPPR